MSLMDVFLFFSLSGNIVANGVAGLPSAYECYLGKKPTLKSGLAFLVCSIIGAAFSAVLSNVAPVPSPFAFIAFLALGAYAFGAPQLLRFISNRASAKSEGSRLDAVRTASRGRLDFEIALLGGLLLCYLKRLDLSSALIAGAGMAIGRGLALILLWILLERLELESPKGVKNSLPLALASLALLGLLFSGIGK
jgi:hypothetical protein